jgi:hypothetical protein
LSLLLRARGSWVPLPQILTLGIAQYNARVFELRRLGFRIANKREGKRSWFRLVPGATVPMSTPTVPAPEVDTLFTDPARDRTYLE